MIQVLFVCLGNICRSPMAEGIFRNLVKRKGLQEKITIDSAGTGHWHIGKVPHEGTREILSENKISYSGMQARQVHESDGQTFDYMIVMDDQNMIDLKQVIHDEHWSKVAKLTDFVKDIQEDHVPDPYHTGDFNYTFELVSEGCENLLNDIINKHDIK